MISVPAGCTVTTGEGGLPCVDIDTPLASARIYLHGAHVARWKPQGHAEVLWLSRASWYALGKPIRGGIPICFPWFGPHANDATKPAHGFARTMLWQLIDITALPDGQIRVTVALSDDVTTRALWAHTFRAELAVTVGRRLEVALTTINLGDAPFTMEAALHTYFGVRDIATTRITGLQGCAYLDKVGALTRRHESAPAVTFAGETDRVYLDTEATCVLDDGERRLAVGKRGSRATVVWNPWIAKAAKMADFGDDEWPGMVCIEAACAGLAAVTLAPQGCHIVQTTIEIA